MRFKELSGYEWFSFTVDNFAVHIFCYPRLRLFRSMKRQPILAAAPVFWTVV